MSYTKTGASDFLAQCLDGLQGTALEVGSLRNTSDAARVSDGWGTLTLAEWAKANDSNVITIDIRNREAQLARVLGVELMRRVTHRVGDAWAIVAGLERLPVFAYLDGPNDADWHLLIAKRLHGTQRIAFDDANKHDLGPKAANAVPWLEANGYRRTIFDGRHLCLEYTS